MLVICNFSITLEGHVLNPITVLIVMMDFIICYFSMTVEGHVLDPIIVLIVTMDFIPMDLIVKVSIIQLVVPRYRIFTEAKAEVNIVYLGTMDPYINRNES